MDISGSATSNPTVLFYPSIISPPGITSSGGDLVWLPNSNSIVAIDNLTGTVYHWDMNGNSLSSPLTGFNPLANYAMWVMDGLIYMEGAGSNDDIRVIGVDPSGQLQALPDIPDWADQHTLFYDTGDAATSPECSLPPPSPGCMDPAALNYDPLAIIDCAGQNAPLSNTNCCKYPCHKDI